MTAHKQGCPAVRCGSGRLRWLWAHRATAHDPRTISPEGDLTPKSNGTPRTLIWSANNIPMLHRDRAPPFAIYPVIRYRIIQIGTSLADVVPALRQH